MEKYPGLDRIIAELKSAEEASPDAEGNGASIPGSLDQSSWTRSDALCYELIEEMGNAGLSCLIYTGTGGVTYCQLRSQLRPNGQPGPNSSLGVQVQGVGPAATRAAICRAYIAFRLRSKPMGTESPEFLLPRQG